MSIAYTKDEQGESGEDLLWIDSVALLSGDDAAAALEANPAYLVGDTTALTVSNPDAKEIVFSDPSQLPEDTTFYICLLYTSTQSLPLKRSLRHSRRWRPPSSRLRLWSTRPRPTRTPRSPRQRVRRTS